MNVSSPSILRRLGSAMWIVGACAVLSSGCASSNPYQEDGNTAAAAERRSSGNVITATDIARYPNNTSVLDILHALVPGFHVTGQASRPGGGLGVSILGMGSPVFVLDGVILDRPDPALAINPRDVEKIEVLKHGASQALYGFRGSNGAIVITTKS